MQVEDLNQGFLTPGPGPFLLHHKVPLGECFGGALRVEEAAEAFGEPRPGGSSPGEPTLANQSRSGLPAPFGTFQETAASLSVSLGDSLMGGNALGQELQLPA